MELCHWNNGHYGFFKDLPFFSDMEKLKMASSETGMFQQTENINRVNDTGEYIIKINSVENLVWVYGG